MKSADVLACRICCNTTGNRIFLASEMMLGSRDSFEYVECGFCGCLQLISPPGDISRYYPQDYYSFQPSPTPIAWKRWLRRAWARHSTGQGDPVGAAISAIRGPMIPREWTALTGVNPRSSVLDVGCGAGSALLRFHEAGFSRLEGCDPFIDHDRVVGGGIPIRKRFLEEVTGTFDLVMMHHAFEHMPDPRAVMASVVKKINPGGWCLIRIPVASSYAWKTYGPDWVQLDAPRHFFLHTVASIALLAQQAGLRLVRTIHDSTEFQFWASEQYKLGVPLYDDRSYMVNRTTSVFTAERLREYRRRAKELNAIGNGDQACFFLCKPA
jgi:SAM-dependent methyltransferase